MGPRDQDTRRGYSPPGDLIPNKALPVLLSSLTYDGWAVADGVTTVVRPRLDQGVDMYEDESDVRLKEHRNYSLGTGDRVAQILKTEMLAFQYRLRLPAKYATDGSCP